MKNGLTLSEFYNSLSDKAVDINQLANESFKILKEELSDTEYQLAASINKQLSEECVRMVKANPSQFMSLNHDIYIDKNIPLNATSQTITMTRKGCIASSSVTYGIDLTRIFTDTHEKLLRAQIKAWDRVEDQSPKIQSGQLIKRSDRLSM